MDCSDFFDKEHEREQEEEKRLAVATKNSMDHKWSSRLHNYEVKHDFLLASTNLKKLRKVSKIPDSEFLYCASEEYERFLPLEGCKVVDYDHDEKVAASPHAVRFSGTVTGRYIPNRYTDDELTLDICLVDDRLVVTIKITSNAAFSTNIIDSNISPAELYDGKRVTARVPKANPKINHDAPLSHWIMPYRSKIRLRTLLTALKPKEFDITLDENYLSRDFIKSVIFLISMTDRKPSRLVLRSSAGPLLFNNESFTETYSRNVINFPLELKTITIHGKYCPTVPEDMLIPEGIAIEAAV
jgi:hypothetical protein